MEETYCRGQQKYLNMIREEEEKEKNKLKWELIAKSYKKKKKILSTTKKKAAKKRFFPDENILFSIFGRKMIA